MCPLLPHHTEQPAGSQQLLGRVAARTLPHHQRGEEGTLYAAHSPSEGCRLMYMGSQKRRACLQRLPGITCHVGGAGLAEVARARLAGGGPPCAWRARALARRRGQHRRGQLRGGCAGLLRDRRRVREQRRPAPAHDLRARKEWRGLLIPLCLHAMCARGPQHMRRPCRAPDDPLTLTSGTNNCPKTASSIRHCVCLAVQ